MSDILDGLERLEADATPGPWHPYFTVHGDPHVVEELDGRPAFPSRIIADIRTAPDDYGRANAELLAEARNALPALLEVARAARRVGEFPLPKVGPDHTEAFNELFGALARLDVLGADE